MRTHEGNVMTAKRKALIAISNERLNFDIATLFQTMGFEVVFADDDKTTLAQMTMRYTPSVLATDYAFSDETIRAFIENAQEIQIPLRVLLFASNYEGKQEAANTKVHRLNMRVDTNEIATLLKPLIE